jgi:hypothetical protein
MYHAFSLLRYSLVGSFCLGSIFVGSRWFMPKEDWLALEKLTGNQQQQLIQSHWKTKQAWV